MRCPTEPGNRHRTHPTTATHASASTSVECQHQKLLQHFYEQKCVCISSGMQTSSRSHLTTLATCPTAGTQFTMLLCTSVRRTTINVAHLTILHCSGDNSSLTTSVTVFRDMASSQTTPLQLAEWNRDAWLQNRNWIRQRLLDLLGQLFEGDPLGR